MRPLSLPVMITVVCAVLWIGMSGAQAFWKKKQRVEMPSYQVEVVASGFDFPWSLAFLPNGDFLVTEREGFLNRVDAKTKKVMRVANIPPVIAKGQGGMLDVVLHPKFAENQWIYLSHVVPVKEEMTLAITRARLNETALEDVQEIFRLPKPSKSKVHFGSRMVFGDDGMLYASVGERGSRPRAQDVKDPAGSIIRLKDDGSIPEDNPFYGREDIHAAIYSYGHRNPQGMALHPETRDLWIHEHGPRGGDEVNIIKAGANYGWPVITHGKEYTSPFRVGKGTEDKGVEPSIKYWSPSIAPSGMAFYTGDDFPQWKGSLLVGALASAHISRLSLKGNNIVGEDTFLGELEERIRDVRQGPDGKIYVVLDAVDANILRLEPKL